MKRRSFLKKSVLTGILTATAPVLASVGIKLLPETIKTLEIKAYSLSINEIIEIYSRTGILPFKMTINV